MKKTKNSAWKRVAAGALSMALVAGAMPANVGGFLTGGNALVASAATYKSGTVNIADLQAGDILEGGVTVTYSGDFSIFLDGNTNQDNNHGHVFGKSWTISAGDSFSFVSINEYTTSEGVGCGWYQLHLNTVNADLTLTAPNLTYTGSAQNLIANAPQGTKFSLTAPIYSFNNADALAEANKVADYHAFMEVKRDSAESSADHETAMILTEAANTLDHYRRAINKLYEGSPEDANFSIAEADYYISHVNPDFSTEDDRINAILDYINTYIRGKNLDDLKERFTTADTSSWSTDVPQKTDAGTYTVYYQGDGVKYNKEIKSVDVIIAKAAPAAGDFAFTPPSDPTYDGNAKEATVTAANTVSGMGNITVGYYSNEACSEVATPTNAGTYYVGITVVEGDNYEALTV